MGKGNCKTRRELFKFRDLVRLILDILRYISGRQDIQKPEYVPMNGCRPPVNAGRCDRFGSPQHKHKRMNL